MKIDRKKLSRLILSLIIFIFFSNYLALKFYWYYTIWYSDMVMHFLGGFWLGLVVVYIDSPKKLSLTSVFRILIFVFLIGLSWEVFEIFTYNNITNIPLNILDTSSDILFDLAGGLYAIFYFFRKIMHVPQNAVQ